MQRSVEPRASWSAYFSGWQSFGQAPSVTADIAGPATAQTLPVESPQKARRPVSAERGIAVKAHSQRDHRDPSFSWWVCEPALAISLAHDHREPCVPTDPLSTSTPAVVGKWTGCSPYVTALFPS